MHLPVVDAVDLAGHKCDHLLRQLNLLVEGCL